MAKIATDISQSKILAEILPLESADMYYDGFGRLPQGYAYTLISPNSFEYDIPCWSLVALLGVLPEPYQMTSNKEGKVQLMLIHHLEKDYYDNPVDACVAMIIKLHELKML